VQISKCGWNNEIETSKQYVSVILLTHSYITN